MTAMSCGLPRRRFLATAAAALCGAAFPAAAVAAPKAMTVWKTSGCGCCLGWIDHIKQAGFAVQAKNIDAGSLMKMKLDAGLRADLASCHTAKLGRYVIEGHVPVREIVRLVAEQADAIGLAVPGMPIGTPGMEDGTALEAYDVLLIRKDGSTERYASYPARS